MSLINTSYTQRKTLEEYLSGAGQAGAAQSGAFSHLLAQQMDVQPAGHYGAFGAQLPQSPYLQGVSPAMYAPSITQGQAQALLGKYVEGYYTEDTQENDMYGNLQTIAKRFDVAGTVDGVLYQQGQVAVTLQELANRAIPLSNIQYVSDSQGMAGAYPQFAGQAAAGYGSSAAQAAALLGREVTAAVTAYGRLEDGSINVNDPYERIVEGTVDKISIEGGVIFAHIGDEMFEMSDIRTIAPLAGAADPYGYTGGQVTQEQALMMAAQAFGPLNGAQNPYSMYGAQNPYSMYGAQSPYGAQGAAAAYGMQGVNAQSLTAQGYSLVGPTRAQFLADIAAQPALITDGVFDNDPSWIPNEDGSFG